MYVGVSDVCVRVFRPIHAQDNSQLIVQVTQLIVQVTSVQYEQ